MRHDIEAMAARLGVSYEQTCHRLSTLHRPGARGVPFFFLRAGPCGQRIEAVLRGGFSVCTLRRLMSALGRAHRLCAAGRSPSAVAKLPDGTAYLCFARIVVSSAARWGEPRPVYVVAMGCSLAHGREMAYADGLDPERAKSRYRLVLPPVRAASIAEVAPSRRSITASRSTRRPRASPYRFEARDRA
jgi:predicted transcriptional regulator